MAPHEEKPAPALVCPRVLILGAGQMAESLFPAIDAGRLKIVAFLEDQPRKTGEKPAVPGIPILDIGQARELAFEYVLLFCRASAALEQRLSEGLGVSRDVLVSFDFAHMALFSAFSLPEIIVRHLEKYPGLKEAVDVNVLLQDPRLNCIHRNLESRATQTLRRKGYIPAKVGTFEDKLPPGLPFWGDTVRYATLALLAHEILSGNVAGSIAELGVYKGNLSRCIRKLFPGRLFYLFDTFSGFVPEQWKSDQNIHNCATDENFSDSSVEEVLRTVGEAEPCVIKQGMFPFSARDVEDTFAFVSIDVDLYQPTKDGLEFFYPRLVPGGYILIHDYGNERWKGCGAAVRDFCTATKLPLTPVCDYRGSAIIAKGEL